MTRVLSHRIAGRPLWLLLLAAVGTALLVQVGLTRWGTPSDEHAYWLAARRLIDGQPLYDPAATIVTPYAYLYPPVLAQLLVPIALVVPGALFSLLWTAAMGLALWWLAGRDAIRALACIAFLPVAMEFWFRNIHLFLAVLLVLGIRGRPGTFAVGAALKVTPGLGLLWFSAQRRWREAAIMATTGLAILLVSIAIAPDQWMAWVAYLGAQDPFVPSSFVPVSLPVRLVAGAALVVVAARLRGWRGEVLFVVAVTLALPSLWFTGLSLLIAAVPIMRRASQPASGQTAAPAPPVRTAPALPMA